jgi:hypothetical protein
LRTALNNLAGHPEIEEHRPVLAGTGEGTCREETFLLVISMAVKAEVVFPEEEENRAMATEYIGLPGELIEKVKEAAAREQITPEELVRDAVENRLSRAEWRKTVEFGHRNARERRTSKHLA